MLIGGFDEKGNLIGYTDDLDVWTISIMKKIGLELKPLLTCPNCKGARVTV